MNEKIEEANLESSKTFEKNSNKIEAATKDIAEIKAEINVAKLAF